MKRKIFRIVPVVQKHLEMILNIVSQMTEGLFYVILWFLFHSMFYVLEKKNLMKSES